MMRKGGESEDEEAARFKVTRAFAKRVKEILGDAPDIVFKEEKKEAEKLDRLVAERRKESGKEHEKRLAKLEKQRQEARAFVRDIINAYDFPESWARNTRPAEWLPR